MNILLQIFLLASAPVCAQTNAERPNGTAPEAGSLEKVFGADLSRDQREALGPNAGLEQLRDALTPEQRDSVRARLSALEANAKTPEDLAAVARGYLLLDEHAPDAGRGALRIAERLRRLRPKSSDGYELTAEGLSQGGDYPAAAEWAKKALELNPRDENARAVYMLAKDRTKLGGAASDASALGRSDAISGSAAVSPAAQEFMNRAVDARRKGDVAGMWESAQAAMRADPTSKDVQAFYSFAASDHAKYAKTKRGPNRPIAFDPTNRDGPPKPLNGPPLWPLAGLGLTAVAGYGLYRGAKQTYASEDGLNPEPTVAPDQARKNYLAAAAVAGAAFVGLAAWEFGPGAMALFSAAGPAASTMAPAFAGAGGAAVGAMPAGAVAAGAATAGTYVGIKTIVDGVSYTKTNKDGGEARPASNKKAQGPQFHPDKSPHIFDTRPGHLPDTLENRELLLETAADKRNFIGIDKFGKEIYARLLPNGKQVWVEVYEGTIRNGGLNEIPKKFS